MVHCPYCGSKVNDDEIFCTQCGKKLPADIYDRFPKETVNYRIWIIPVVTFIIVLVFTISYHFYLENKTDEARDLYKQGEELALEGDYKEALSLFNDALKLKPKFPSAQANKDFVVIAIDVLANLKKAEQLSEDKNFQESLALIDEAENNLKNSNGEAVNLLINQIIAQRKSTQLMSLNEKINNDPSIDEVKNLLWEAEAIQTEEANKIAAELRDRIVAFTSATASEQLKTNQFANARDIVNDGLKYAPDSEKLQSLKTTIEKEKTVFETEQQELIEQALIAAEEERHLNKNDAVEIVDINITSDDQDNLVVEGEIKSVATVPINTISVEYVILTSDDEELLSNEVYIYPDTLYPDEKGKFDYTHYEISKDISDLKVKIDKVKWFLD